MTGPPARGPRFFFPVDGPGFFRDNRSTGELMRIIAAIAALFAAAVLLSPALAADEALPVPATVEEARARLRFLKEQAGQVDRWVEEHWEEEFPQWYPALPRGP